MRKKMAIAVLGVSLLMLASCVSSRSSRAMRRAERMMEKQERQAQKDYKKAKEAHYEHQAPKTKQMMKEDKKRARELNRHLRRY
jgi:Flp pilus assembly protein TadB